jgi:subtilase family serine protease
MHAIRFAAICAVLTSVPAFAAAATPQVAATVPHTAYRDLGQAPIAAPISIVVSLAYRNPVELQQLILAQNDSHSPYYRHWLTSAQFDATFAPTPAQYAAVTRSLRAAGFQISQTYTNRSSIDAIGTVGLAERYFKTRIDRVRQTNYPGSRYANVTTAYVPADVGGLVYAVSGLHNLDLNTMHPIPVRAGKKAADALRRYAAAQAPIFGPISTVTSIPGFAPLAFQRAYDFPITRNSKYDGRGSKSGILIDADFLNTDISAYLSAYHIKPTGPAIQRVLIDQKYGQPSEPTPIGGDSVEATLDIESLYGTSPGTALTVYVLPSFMQCYTKCTLDAVNQIVSDNKVDSVSMSFGGCELADTSYAEAFDHVAQQGAALGITFHASSGDLGAYSCQNASTGSVTLAVQVPADSPNVVAVGGTTLFVSATGAYQGEFGWNSAGGASGGGISGIFLLPSWQRGLPNLSPLARNLPDISFVADPLTGLAFYYEGSWDTSFNPIGGTSLASPIFGSAIAQMVQVTGSRVGLAAAKLFRLWKSTGYAKDGTTYFHDSLFGNNGFYVAGPGYDNVTGIGSVDIWNAARALKN